MLLTKCDSLGHFIFQAVSIEKFVLVIVNMCGYNSHNDNNRLLDTLDKVHLITFILQVGGDLNMILDHNMDCWPPRSSTAVNLNFKLFMQKLNLIDVWRNQNHDTNAYTWSNKSSTRKSRLDFWLSSDNLNIDKTSVNIITTPLTDHSALYSFLCSLLLLRYIKIP